MARYIRRIHKCECGIETKNNLRLLLPYEIQSDATETRINKKYNEQK